MHQAMESVLNFNIDNYLNPFIPPNFTSKLPKSVSRWLGYRSGEHKEPPLLIVHFWAFLGCFLGLLFVGAVFKYAPGISDKGPPILIASLGASAVLEYAAIQTPLAQPRNTIFGHGISAVIAVGISKAFQTHPDFANLQWIAASIACATCTLVMSLTNTVHPPGGATAILACVEANVIAMGWWFVPVILVAVSLMMAVSLINNNIMRRYPVYWWTPAETGQRWRKQQPSDEESHGESHGEPHGEPHGESHEDSHEDSHEESHQDKNSDAQSETTLQHTLSHDDWHSLVNEIRITAHEFRLPAYLHLQEKEIALLREIQLRIGK